MAGWRIMKSYLIRFGILLGGVLGVLTSCLGVAPTAEVKKVDSLNLLAYKWRYMNVDSAYWYAGQAEKCARFYTDGRSEALNTKGFCYFMRMDYKNAETCFHRIPEITQNELECLIADVGLMRIYQKTAKNKLFYDCRNRALKRMNRIEEDRNLFTEKRELVRLDYAFSEFYLVSALYYSGLQQEHEAWEALDKIAKTDWVKNDTGQSLFFHYACGLIGKPVGKSFENEMVRLNKLEELFYVLQSAREHGFVYWEGMGSLELADWLLHEFNIDAAVRKKRQILVDLKGESSDENVSVGLACKSLACFERYGVRFLDTGGLVLLAKCLNYSGRYQEAIILLEKALSLINAHRRCHTKGEILDTLAVSGGGNSYLCLEMDWLQDSSVYTLPEWILRIREQLSVSFAGLGYKKESDYNRNIYLDVLSEIRQDKELESRYERLEKRETELDFLIMAVGIGVVVVLVCLFLLDRFSKRKNSLYVNRLEQLLALCREIILHVPMDAGAIQQGLDRLFGFGKVKLMRVEGTEKWSLNIVHRLSKENKVLVRLIQPYLDWNSDSEALAVSFQEEYVRLEKERYVYEQHIVENKRQNILKKTCLAIVNGIHPYLDRMLNEVHKLVQKDFTYEQQIRQEKYRYIDELAQKINEYNEILALWVKMRHGSIALNIESFELDELFQLIKKGHRNFEQKGLMLKVVDTKACVRADRALTLFMINTLTDNARKYTMSGGQVKLEALEYADYVEISVEDTGIGLSERDVNRILSEKVYDPHVIGMSDDAGLSAGLRESKGSGFGLMNCKGIIEKYRKTSSLFQICTFGIQSKLGEGSRFYFRLPKGIHHMFSVLWITLMTMVFAGCVNENGYSLSEDVAFNISQMTRYDRDFIPMLENASALADSVYYANLYGEYTQAISYADSVFRILNRHYWKYAVDPQDSIRLYSSEYPAEISWWNTYFDTDYHVILDVRNEAAVAYLALKKWEAYEYNNKAYTSLYKLHSEDRTLESYCSQLQHSTTSKIVGIVLCCLIGFILLVGYYWLYVRKRILDRRRLEQVFDINRAIFDVTARSEMEHREEALQSEENTLKILPKRIVQSIFGLLNELIPVKDLGLSVYNRVTDVLEYSSDSGKSISMDKIQLCFFQNSWIYESKVLHIPLSVEWGDSVQKVGVLTLEVNESLSRQSRLLLELVERYIAVIVLNSVVKTAGRYRDIESAYEETYKAMWEDNQIHVQNLVLDNCLSAIKHETVYYPSRIRQIVGKLKQDVEDELEEKRQIVAMSELMEYYKGVFSILSSCASRQLEEIVFRRGVIEVKDLLDYAKKFCEKASRKSGLSVNLEISSTEGRVVGDKVLLQLLVESLFQDALSVRKDGVIKLGAVLKGCFYEFYFVDCRRMFSDSDIQELFYPDLSRIQAEEQGNGNGSALLVCKQIIREHDEYAGRRGCRMDAVQTDAGFTVLFSVPSR